MAITATGNSYTTGDQVTAATQNAQVNAATFVSGSVDNSTTQLSGGAIIVKDGGITPAKLSVGHPTWDTSSRVGIGLTAPVNKLEIVGTNAAAASSGSAENGATRLWGTSSSAVLDSGIGGDAGWLQARLYNNYASQLPLFLNPNGGNVGIGTTSATEKLTVSGAVVASGALSANGTSVSAVDHFSNAMRYFSFGASGAVGNHQWYIGAGAAAPTSPMLLNSTGLGIGTASPGHKLTVSEASTNFAALITNSTSSGNGLKINAGDNSGDRVLELNDKDGTSLMQVGATGNLTLNIGDLIISASTTPASASATGTVGTVAWDTNYFYVCTATNTWKRSGLSSW